MVTDEQVKLLRRKLMQDKTLEASAAASGMSERTARKWREGQLPSQSQKERSWRTREDPFAEVWESHAVPLLEADAGGRLQSKTIFAELQTQFPGRFSDGQLRTLQRRVRDWRAVHGPDKEVYFEQEHKPGREGALDFTHATELGVTIAGVLFEHLLFVFRLSFSGWTSVQIAFGETFEALVQGLQGALWDLGGAPAIARSDNMSAATHELKRTAGRKLTARFKAVLDHYDMKSTRIHPGKSNENGVVEKANHLVKSAVEQALIVRGSKEFESVDDYNEFLQSVIEKAFNKSAATKLATEHPLLRPLPSAPVPNYTTHHPTVRGWSTFRLSKRVYSVPSRLIGHELKVLQYADVLEVYYGNKHIETIERLRGNASARIDYRHIIWSLVRKPGAFARYKYREELFPSLTFRRAYDALEDSRGDRADVEYVRILHLAASTMEADVERALALLLERDVRFDYAAVKAIALPETNEVPKVTIGKPDLAAYDRLIGGA